jgi:hypothetical protein
VLLLSGAASSLTLCDTTVYPERALRGEEDLP